MTIRNVGKMLFIKGQSLTRSSKQEFYNIHKKLLQKKNSISYLHLSV